MGKASRAEQAFPNAAPATRFSRCRCGVVVGKVISAKCVSVLLLAVCGFLSALFMLLHLRASGGGVPDDPDIVAEIEGGFILLVPYSEIASQRGALEKEIYDQIGVPNSKVSVSMCPYNYTNTTYVKFGVLPDPRNASMSIKSINALRTSLIRLTLQQLNLSLTPSVFGDPLCLEILGFPGGITVSLPRNASHAVIQPIFNITFDSTIREVREFLEMKNELAIILQQTPDEELFVRLTNTNGSTVSTPVTLEVSISPIDRSNFLQPYRLKQLAQIITEWRSRNLGLNTSIFGRFRDLKLSPLLEAFLPSFAPSPSLSPTPTPSLYWPSVSEHPKTNASRNFSCPALVKKQNEATPHRRLIHASAMVISPQLSTWLHRKYTSEGKRNSIAVVAPTFIAPAPEPK
ncbi:unnamed protein product [Urochloa humidicola]